MLGGLEAAEFAVGGDPVSENSDVLCAILVHGIAGKGANT